MPSFPHTAVAHLVAISLISAPFAQGLAAGTGQRAPLTRAGYENCQTGDAETFKRAVEAISLAALETELKTIDYASVISDEWRRLGVDAVIDRQVDRAVDDVRSETSWSGLAKSLIDKEQAQILATTVAERVYRSNEVKSAIEGLATGVGKVVGQSLENATRDSAGPTLDCLRSFLGPRYGPTVARFVSTEVERDFGIETGKVGPDISSGSVLRQSTEGIAGAAILLVRRQLANMATRIGQRLAGSILSRLVSVVAGGVGLVLIAKDIWELRNGVLPIIAEEMKSKATKDSVKDELAKAISEQIGDHAKEISAKSAERIAGIWLEFRNAHAKALELAERHEGFRAFLDTVKPESLARLDEVTALLLSAEGEEGILRRLNDGSLNEAIRFMPEPAMTIARDTRSVDAALRWTDLAGDQLGKVVALEIYRRAAPADFTRANLLRVLSLDDPLAISRLATLDRDARQRLLELDDVKLKSLARSLSKNELTTLAGYLNGLQAGPRDRVLSAVAAEPAKMQILASSRVRRAVVASSDQAAAVEMMLREGGTNPEAATRDLVAAWEGRVSPILLWDKHPLLIIAAAVVLLVLMLMLRRLFSVRRVKSA